MTHAAAAKRSLTHDDECNELCDRLRELEGAPDEFRRLADFIRAYVEQALRSRPLTRLRKLHTLRPRPAKMRR